MNIDRVIEIIRSSKDTDEAKGRTRWIAPDETRSMADLQSEILATLTSLTISAREG